MWLFALIAIAFNGWMAWTLYASVKTEKPSGWRDDLNTVWIACGSVSSIIVAVRALVF